MTASLAGKRILVVDDEEMIATLLKSALEDEDCTVLGPFERVALALKPARTETIDFALLDVNVAGEKIYPVAETLDRRGIPFLLLSGYGEDDRPADRAHWKVFGKPFNINAMVTAIRQALADPTAV